MVLINDASLLRMPMRRTKIEEAKLFTPPNLPKMVILFFQPRAPAAENSETISSSHRVRSADRDGTAIRDCW